MLRELYHQLPTPLLSALRYLYVPNHHQVQQEIREATLTEKYLCQLLDETAATIHSGPFTGLKYIRQAVCSALAPKLIGSYEKELISSLLRLVHDCGLIIDIGAAEGYYAVGLARLKPQARIIAYEATAEGRELLKELAALNEVKNLEVRGLCSVQNVRDDTVDFSGATLVLCDAEGAELELLDPAQASGLRGCNILVELHPWVHPNVKNTLSQRFTSSHDIEVIRANLRLVEDFPEGLLAGITSKAKLALLNERRPPNMEWLCLRPKAVA